MKHIRNSITSIHSQEMSSTQPIPRSSSRGKPRTFSNHASCMPGSCLKPATLGRMVLKHKALRRYLKTFLVFSWHDRRAPTFSRSNPCLGTKNQDNTGLLQTLPDQIVSQRLQHAKTQPQTLHRHPVHRRLWRALKPAKSCCPLTPLATQRLTHPASSETAKVESDMTKSTNLSKNQFVDINATNPCAHCLAWKPGCDQRSSALVRIRVILGYIAGYATHREASIFLTCTEHWSAEITHFHLTLKLTKLPYTLNNKLSKTRHFQESQRKTLKTLRKWPCGLDEANWQVKAFTVSMNQFWILEYLKIQNFAVDSTCHANCFFPSTHFLVRRFRKAGCICRLLCVASLTNT